MQPTRIASAEICGSSPCWLCRGPRYSPDASSRSAIRRAQGVGDLRAFALDPPQLPVGEADERHVGGRNHRCRTPSTREDGDLAEHVARPEGAQHPAVMDDLGASSRHREGAVPEVALLDEGRSGVDGDLRARLRDRRPLIEREGREERDRVEPGRLHGHDASHPVVERW